MKILTDLVDLRRKIGGLKAEKKQYVLFPVKSAKDLMIKLRDAADELGMPIAGGVVATSVAPMTVVDVVDKNGNPGKYFLATAQVTLRFESSDGSFREFCGAGNGGGNDDKSLGKAMTYAWKDAMVKALALPDAEMVDTDDENVPVKTLKVKATMTMVLTAIQEAFVKKYSVL